MGGNLTKATMSLDSHLDSLKVTPETIPKEGALDETDDTDETVRMRHLSAVYSGPHFAAIVPKLASMGKHCVGVDANAVKSKRDGARGIRLVFHFAEMNQRDRFLTCMKILQGYRSATRSFNPSLSFSTGTSASHSSASLSAAGVYDWAFGSVHSESTTDEYRQRRP